MAYATSADEALAAHSPSASSRMLVALGAGASVAIALGVYSRAHDPTHHALFTLVFTLADGAVVAKFPSRADQVALVSNGRGTMPAWSVRLTTAQIDDVVRYTREGLWLEPSCPAAGIGTTGVRHRWSRRVRPSHGISLRAKVSSVLGRTPLQMERWMR